MGTLFIKRTLALGALFLMPALFSPEAHAQTTPASVPAVSASPSSAPAPLGIDKTSALRVEVDQIQGQVQAQRQGDAEFQDITNGAMLRSGDTVRTVQGTCRLVLESKAKITVGPNTTLKVAEALRDTQARTDSVLLDLQQGKMRVALAKLKKGSKFEVATPAAVATVRGTTFYLGAGDTTQLYVDESDGGVALRNIFSGDSVLVPAFSASNAFLNGQMDPPSLLTPEQREAFIQNWQKEVSSASQQFGIEEIPLVPAAAAVGGLPDLNDLGIDDAALDKLAEQNLPGANGFIFTEPLAPLALPKEVSPEELLAQQERDMLRLEIARILGDQDFDNADANLARVSDSQTGKVFTDAHGNRVRVDQYIFQPSPDTVSLLSLTARTGAYQNGVSAIQFMTQFNRPLTSGDGLLRDLPWNDWMRVVTDEQLTGADVPAFYEQFIVHEHFADTETAPDLYPENFFAVLTQPLQPPPATQGSIEFLESYSAPFFADTDQGAFWIQGLDTEFMSIFQSTGETLLSGSSVFDGVRASFASINGDSDITFTDSDGAQTTGLSSDPRLADLDTTAGIEAFRNDGAVHPAFFEQVFNGDRILTGLFLPINDQGQVLDAPGFRMRGLRDVVFPNSAVNGGNYNLEMLFVFAHSDAGDPYQEQFRIDLLVTPEIFSRYGLKNPDGTRDTGTNFPSSLDFEEGV